MAKTMPQLLKNLRQAENTPYDAASSVLGRRGKLKRPNKEYAWLAGYIGTSRIRRAACFIETSRSEMPFWWRSKSGIEPMTS